MNLFEERALELTMFTLVAAVWLAGQPGGVAPGVAPSSAEAAAQDVAYHAWQKRLESIDSVVASVVDLRADFEQRRRTPLLKKPLVSKGVVLTKGEWVRWDTASPRASSLVIGGGEIRMYYPADKLVEVYAVGDGFADLAGAPLPRLRKLKERFDLSPLRSSQMGADDANADLVAVRLSPRSAELRKHVASVSVLLDAVRGVATKVVMVDPDGEVTEIVFTNVRTNSGVKDEELVLKLADDVRVSRPLPSGKTAGPSAGDAKGSAPAAPEGQP